MGSWRPPLVGKGTHACNPLLDDDDDDAGDYDDDDDDANDYDDNYDDYGLLEVSCLG